MQRQHAASSLCKLSFLETIMSPMPVSFHINFLFLNFYIVLYKIFQEKKYIFIILFCSCLMIHF